jgi:hypothetical protein
MSRREALTTSSSSPDHTSPASAALRQLDLLLQSITAAIPSPLLPPPPSLFDADNLCLYCDSPLTFTSSSTGALLLLPSTIELPCGHRLCRPCFSGVSSRRHTCPVPLCTRDLPLELIAAVSTPSPQPPLQTPMIKSKSEPSLFPFPVSGLQVQGVSAPSSSAGGGQAFHRVPSLGQLLDAEGDTDGMGLTSDSIALTLPLHLLDIAAVKTIVDAAAVFDVAHNFTPALYQAAPATQHSSVLLSDIPLDIAPRTDDDSHAVLDVSCERNVSSCVSISHPLPSFIKPSVPLLPTRDRVSKGDVSPLLPPFIRLPWHLELPPVMHTFTLKTEHPGKPGTMHSCCLSL